MVLKETTTWNCVITLIATTLGATIVAVPFNFANSGLALSSGLLITMVLFADASLICLVRAGDYVRNLKNADGTRKYNRPGIQECTRAVLGPVWERMLQCALVLLLFFAASLFLCILSGSAVKILGWAGMQKQVLNEKGEPQFKNVNGTQIPKMEDSAYQWMVTLFAAAACYPLTTLPNLDSLKFASLFSNMCIGYLFIVVCIFAVERMINHEHYLKEAIANKVFIEGEEEAGPTTIELIAQILGCVACFSTSFCNQFNILELKYDLEVGVEDGKTEEESAEEEKKNENKKKSASKDSSEKDAKKTCGKSIDAVIHISLAVCCFVNLVFGFAGYVLAGGMENYPICTSERVTNCIPDNIVASQMFDKTWILKIATILVALSNLLRYPLIVVPLRGAIRSLVADIRGAMKKDNSKKSDNKDEAPISAKPGAQPLLENGNELEVVSGSKLTEGEVDGQFLEDLKDTKLFAGLSGLAETAAGKRGRSKSVESAYLNNADLENQATPLLPNLLNRENKQIVEGQKVNADGENKESEELEVEQPKKTGIAGMIDSCGIYFEMLVINALLALSVIILKSPGPVLDVLSWNGIPIICFIVPGALYGGVHSLIKKNSVTFVSQFLTSRNKSSGDSYGAADKNEVAVSVLEASKPEKTSSKNRSSISNYLPNGLSAKFRKALGQGKVMGYTLSGAGCLIALCIFLSLYIIPLLKPTPGGKPVDGPITENADATAFHPDPNHV